ncbi:MAG: hypothetical protein DI603_15500 [Roseateles depolymerans]|uniref:diguanylate cyclase n=1 Tax=Roseateles depolymerans TaxID=76731 RepID=A0A2W5FGT2_9BURK|nr:MAG: hypothetical protein DI603_15500 [Roseateles depolymerans]
MTRGHWRKTLAGLALLGLPLWAGAVTAASGSEQQMLLALVRRAYNYPDAALAELQRRWPADFAGDHGRESAWLLARGRVLVAAGRTEAADEVASRLVALPEGVDRAWLLRAYIQERLDRPVGQFVQRALVGMTAACGLDQERPSPAPGCDVYGAADALWLLAREQSGQGTLVSTVSTLRKYLVLAEALNDRQQIASAHGLMALTFESQDLQDAARAEIRAGREAAQGDAQAMAYLSTFESLLARRSGDLAAQAQAMETALALAEEADAPHLAAVLRGNMVDGLMHRGLLKEAVATGRQALPVLQRFQDRRFERALRHNLAIAYIKLHQFDAGRQSLAQADELGADRSDMAQRARELRELAETWAEVGQYKEALAAFHAERDLNARANERNREAAMEELHRKYDSAAKQRDLELLARDGQVKDQQLANSRLAQQVGYAVGALLLLSVTLIVVTLLRMRRAQARLTANQRLLRAQSERDPLTDLSNRRHFLAVMEHRARDTEPAGFRGALMMIDIDHFKHINDQQGHAAGDAVIVAVARRIREAVRDEDLVVRWGGEEFLVYAQDLSGEELAGMAGRVLQGIAGRPVDLGEGRSLPVTASIGFASFPLGGPEAGLRLHWEQAVNWADMVLYRAKAEGRNRAVGIAEVRAADPEALAALLQDLDQACHGGQVRLLTLLGPA